MDMEKSEYGVLLSIFSCCFPLLRHILVTIFGKYLVNFVEHRDQLFRALLLLLRNDHDFEHDASETVHHHFPLLLVVRIVDVQDLFLVAFPVSVYDHLLENVVEVLLHRFDAYLKGRMHLIF